MSVETLPNRPPLKTARPKKSKRLRNIAVLLALLILGAGGWWGWRIRSAEAIKPARTETVTQGDVTVEVVESGSIEPLKTVEVKSKVAGRISKLYVQEGSRVRAGQLLAEIDPTEVNAQVAQFRAQLAGAQARLEQARKGAVYQKDQTAASIRQTREAFLAAQAQLKAAEAESRSQPSLYQSDVAQAEANLRAAQESYNLLKNSTQPQDRVQAQADYEDARENADVAQKNLDRQQTLLKKGFISQQSVDALRGQLATAKSRLEQAKKRLDLLDGQQQAQLREAQSQVAQSQAALNRAKAGESQIAIKRQQLASARAAVEQSRAQWVAAQSGTQQDLIRRDAVTEAQADVTQIQNELNENLVHLHDTRLFSEVNGVVTRRYIEEGELITSGTSAFSSGTPVLQVADLSHMLVKMSVNEVDVNRIQPGQLVDIRVDGVKNHPFSGHVRKVAPASVDPSQQQNNNNGVIRFAVEVLIDHPDDRLKPGMSAKCHIIIARRRDVLRLPEDSVKGEGSKASVEIKGPLRDGKQTFEPRKIVAGLRGDSFIEIVSGLKKGDHVKPGVFNGPPRKALDIFR
jgi:HlyD family secretion protein